MVELEPLFWVAPLVGGALIGLASAALMAFNGRIAGISGIFGGVVLPSAGELSWRLAFVGGLIAGGLAMFLATPDAFAITIERSYWAVGLAGLLVGFGTRMGSGCTSGHGICGISRLSPRSIVATLSFIAAGAVAVAVVNLLGGTV